MIGLADEPVGSNPGICKHLFIHSATDENDFLVRPDSPAFADQVHATHSAHCIIRDDKVGLVVDKRLERAFRIQERAHLVPHWFEGQQGQLQNEGFIVHHEKSAGS